jgi:hypothetical protein
MLQQLGRKLRNRVNLNLGRIDERWSACVPSLYLLIPVPVGGHFAVGRPTSSYNYLGSTVVTQFNIWMNCAAISELELLRRVEAEMSCATNANPI